MVEDPKEPVDSQEPDEPTNPPYDPGGYEYPIYAKAMLTPEESGDEHVTVVSRVRMMVVTMVLGLALCVVHWLHGVNWPLVAGVVLIDFAFVADDTLQLSLVDGVLGQLREVAVSRLPKIK